MPDFNFTFDQFCFSDTHCVFFNLTLIILCRRLDSDCQRDWDMAINPPSLTTIYMPNVPKPVGKVISSFKNIGLALMRLDHLGAPGMTVEAANGSLFIRTFRPTWWPLDEK
jgi:hypothetical protein